MRSIKALAAALVGLLWLSQPAHAFTPTSIGTKSCTTVANACTITVNSTVASGSSVLVIATVGRAVASGITVADSAGNCAGYTVQSYNNTSANTTIVAAYCATTSAALTSGSGTVTITYSGGTQKFAAQAFTVSGFNTVNPFDKQGAAVSQTTVVNTAFVGGTTPSALAYSSEYALAVTIAYGATTDTLGTYTGGFSTVSSLTTGTNDPEQFLAGQTLTCSGLPCGTATYGATPNFARSIVTQMFLFPTAGATPLARPTRTFMGVGQ